MKVQPLHDWAVIRPSEQAEKTVGGLYIPDAAKEKPQEGIVEAIGPGAFEEEKRHKKKEEKKERRFVPTVVKAGDRVVYGRYAGQTYTVDGEERVLVRERDILGIFPPALQIPATTALAGEKSLMKPAAHTPAELPAKAKKPAAKTTKKAAKKAVKKDAAKKAPAKPSKAKTTRLATAKKKGKKK